MKKRRVTLNLDEDLVEYLQSVEDRSMSSVANDALREALDVDANDALREALELEAHRRALLEWLDELNERYGAPTPEDYARANEILDEAAGLGDSRTSAA
ncbi:MAG: hypothetical protein ACRD0K_22600 [Egibacteraceae bacterium]